MGGRTAVYRSAITSLGHYTQNQFRIGVRGGGAAHTTTPLDTEQFRNLQESGRCNIYVSGTKNIVQVQHILQSPKVFTALNQGC